MKIGSPLLRQLDADLLALHRVECRSLYCLTDLTVFPGWRAVLPVGPRQAVPVWTHRQLILHPQALGRLADVLLAP
jgi:triacylglycerol lipase